MGQTPIQTGKTRGCGCLQSEIYRDNLKLIVGTSISILEAGKDRLIANNTKPEQQWAAEVDVQRI